MALARARARWLRCGCLLGCCALLVVDSEKTTRAQTQLPEVVVSASKQKPKPQRTRMRVPTVVAPATPAQQLNAKANSFDQARSNLYTTIGTTSDTISHDTIQILPQGTNAPVEKVLLQAPGVSQDSAASGLLHVRNDHANVQYRINGIMLPDGVTGFGSIFDTSFIGSIALVTGALPAEYGLRTVGLVDITTRTDLFNNSGTRQRVWRQPWHHYSRASNMAAPSAAPVRQPRHRRLTATRTFRDRGLLSPAFNIISPGAICRPTVGLENPTPAYNAIHDFSQQERGFAYMSAFVDPTTRVSLIAGTVEQQLSDPQQSRSADRRLPVQRFRRHQLQFSAAQREPERVHSVRRAGVAEIRRTASTGNCPISPGTIACISCRIRSAIFCSTASPRTSPANPTPTASRATAPTSSIRPIRSAPASPSAPSRHSSAIRRWSSPAWRATAADNGRTVDDHRQRLQDRLAGGRRMSRTNGRSPTSSPSMPACASTRCGNTSTPTSSARA